ncbi:MAG: hypothetical protein J7501_03765 [Bdellovibrio sp.]|nr:hypothetical protein [Bdellovibrio sp.]
MNKIILCSLVSLLFVGQLSFAQETVAPPTELSTDPGIEVIPVPEIPASEAPAPPVATEPAAPAAPAATPAHAPSAPPETASPTTVARPRPQRLQPKKSVSSWAAGISTMQWNETLAVTQTGKTAYLPANFNGIGLVFQKETFYLRWGWNFGGVIGVGNANGGGTDQGITYTQDRQSYNMLGLTPRVFWRLTNRVNVGVTGFIYSRNITWPTSPGADVDSGRRMNIMALADLNIRILDRWDFYQGIGNVAPQSTMWKIGVNYRF